MPFDDIRPYADAEVRPTLNRLLQDNELLDTVACFRFPVLKNPALASCTRWLFRPVVRAFLQRETRGIHDVRSFQDLVEKYMRRMIEATTPHLTCSGVEHLVPGQAYLFISNHRDIAMDPAFVNWTLYHNGANTVRIAIGDNLLTKPFVSDLMRLNKSFIVKRSLSGPRQMLAAFKQLSGYIAHSIQQDHEHIWIAQREGRAKDGVDRTEPAVMKMISVNKPKDVSFTDYMNALHIVPVAIAYEFDPCDEMKARELTERQESGAYEKSEHEDVASIALGITGMKGSVHVAFGSVISGCDTAEALAAAIDQQIVRDYKIFPINVVAYRKLYGTLPVLEDVLNMTDDVLALAELQLTRRVDAMPARYRAMCMAMYANPVVSKLAFAAEPAVARNLLA